MLQFIDTHIHLQDFKPDFALQVLNNPAVKGLVLVSAQEGDFDKIAQLSRTYSDKLIPAFGIHPWHWREPSALEYLKKMLEEFPQAAVGEIGVDELKEHVSDGQHKLFSAQIEMARSYQRPVIVHAARAFNALILHEEELKSVKYVHHSFVKNRELLNFINRSGGYIGLGALFLKQKNAAAMWQMMPKDRILFETDAPYQLDESAYNTIVEENLQKLAEIAGMKEDELAALLVQNAEDFFKL